MRTHIRQLGKPRTNFRANFARPRFCPTCAKTKPAVAFQQTKRDKRLNIVCWQCRHDDKRAEATLFKKSFRRIDSPFRKNFWAIHKMLKRRLKKQEVTNVSIEKQSIAFLKFPERVAAIVGKTYPVRGDDFKMADDEALTRIRDLLDELDDSLIERNKNKRLSR